MTDKEQQVKVVTAADRSSDESLKTATHVESSAPPPPRAECQFVEGEPEEMAKELVRLLREEAKVV